MFQKLNIHPRIKVNLSIASNLSVTLDKTAVYYDTAIQDLAVRHEIFKDDNHFCRHRPLSYYRHSSAAHSVKIRPLGQEPGVSLSGG